MTPAPEETDERTAVLLVDHGSRRSEADAALADLATRLRRSGRYAAVRHAHMEIASPTIAESFAALVAEGMREIIVVPYFLAPGRHAAHDIPELCRAAATPHPAVRWRLTDPVGSSRLMLDVIIERIEHGRK